MRRSTRHLGLAAAALTASAAATARAGDVNEFNDPSNDAVLRRTDSCNCGTLLPNQGQPDVKRIVISPWSSPTPSTDPYNGESVGHNVAHLVRIDIVLSGLVNPPGPLGLNAQPYSPFLYGQNPIYGFVEIDVDNDRDTGGETPAAAAQRYLGNAARFGAKPEGSIGVRAARSGDDLFQPYTNSPQVCLSGADWVIALCGCFTTTVVSKTPAGAPTFGPGAEWIVEGRFFRRSGGYVGASIMTGGTTPGAYDPVVRLRFKHSTYSDQTTISLVYALNQTGAAMLAGQSAQSIDTVASNHTSIAEGVTDLIVGAQSRPLTGLAYVLTNRWAGKSMSSATDTTRWRPNFLVGTAYKDPTDALYVWTDVGFECKTGDVNGDGLVNLTDRAAVASAILSLDGGPSDADGLMNGQVTIPWFGTNFNLHDVTGNGVIGGADLNFYGPACVADFNNSGTVTLEDIFNFLGAWFAGSITADINHIDGVTVQDIFDFLGAWFAGC